MRPTFHIGIFSLALIMASSNAWSAEAIEDTAGKDVNDHRPQTSNMDSWQEDERRNSWTWFGMGYESRRASSIPQGSPAAGAGGKGGQGGPGGGMKR